MYGTTRITLPSAGIRSTEVVIGRTVGEGVVGMGLGVGVGDDVGVGVGLTLVGLALEGVEAVGDSARSSATSEHPTSTPASSPAANLHLTIPKS
ncbi:hypothetical protein [Kribbella sp. DT2]|uniref:hypothetical protein n=1 Tax=Kribbella sp. DT2 TaxID=3393427 RepID=UPI003CED7FD7